LIGYYSNALKMKDTFIAVCGNATLTIPTASDIYTVRTEQQCHEKE
jgi:hypothetical protein